MSRMSLSPSWRFFFAFAFVSAGVLGASACDPTSSEECSANDDCADDEVCNAGVCEAANDDTDGGEPEDADGGEPEGEPEGPDGGEPEGPDGGEPEGPDGGEPDGEPGAEPDGGEPEPGSPCVPNNNGIITRAETPVSFDLAPRFTAGGTEETPVPVDLVGTLEGDMRVWTFDAPYASDRQVEIGASANEGFWFSPSFPTADYVAPLDSDANNYGAFRREDNALLLLGVASADESVDTLLTYDPPVVALAFPLEVGSTFSSTTDVSGTLEGNSFYTSTDTHTMTVDERGILRTFSGDIDVLRMRLELELEIPVPFFPFLLTYRYVRHSFLTECLGQVGFVASKEDEPENNFTEAVEVRRLGWQ